MKSADSKYMDKNLSNLNVDNFFMAKVRFILKMLGKRDASVIGFLRVFMANINDVSAYILKKEGTMTAIKLQKLMYDCQAWSLVWEDKPLFKAKIKAWANGPVITELYGQHKGKYEVASWVGHPSALTPEEKSTIDGVLGFYGDKTSQWLSDLTHQESPWLEARKGLAPGMRGNQEISLASMAEYYGALR
jgi:uncharacterized phage-associated protein